MKGLAAIAGFLLAASAVMLIIIVSLLIPIVFTKIHIVKILEVEYKYNNADLALLELLSDRDVYRPLSLYIAGLSSLSPKFDRGTVVSRITTKLDKIVETQCYKLETSKEVLVDKTSLNCEPEYKAKTTILIPHNLTTEELTLYIDWGKPTMPMPGVTTTPTEKCCCDNTGCAAGNCCWAESCPPFAGEEHIQECVDWKCTGEPLCS